MAKLTRQEKERFKAEQEARRARHRKPSKHKLKRDAEAAEKSRLWCLARLNLPGGGDAKDAL